MKYFLSYFIFLIMPITSCNQVRPDVFLDVYPDVSNNDTIYYLQITIKNKSHLPLYLDQCDYLSHYLQVFDYKGHNSKKEYDADLEIYGFDRSGLLNDVLQVVNTQTRKISSVEARSDKDKNATIRLTVAIQNLEHLQQIVAKLKQIPDVYSVERTRG